MSKLARACAVAVAVATSLAGGIAAAQIQGGAARKTAPPAIALGVPVTKATISQRSSSSSTSGSGSSLSFESGQPALRYQAVDLPAAKDPVRREAVKDGAKEVHVSARGAAATGARDTREFAPAPGVLRANMPPVSFADAQSVLKTRVLPANVNQGVTAMPSAPKAGKTSTSTSTATSFAKISGDAAASGPASIAELARALRNHPDLIYQYVRNNIEYYPTFGLQKGALGAVLDNQATAHDQAALMVELLRASGFEANYVRGIAKLSAAQLAEWWGVSTANACGVLSLLGQAQIPVYQINATAAGSCPGTTAALTEVSIEHVWVKTRINGNWYVFDPSYKPHTFKSGIDLAGASTTGYDAAAYQSSAQSGATVSADYIQNLNRTNIRNNLATYATRLASYLRTNKPAATLDDVLGGKTIVPFYGALRQTSLPYQNTAWGSEELAELPGYMKPTLRVQYQGIDQTYTSDAIYGKRLTLTYNGANQPILKLDGVAVGAPGTAVTPGASTPITFTVTHNAYVSTWANHSFTQRIRGGGTNTFLIANGWGPAGRGPAENYRRTLSDLKAYVGNNPANRTDPSGLIAREAVELAAGVGGAISDGWSASVAAFQNESLGDVALKTLEGLNPTVGAAMGAGVRLIGAAKGAQSIADGPQLARQLAHSEAASIFVNGGLRPEIIAGSKVAIPGSQLNNPSLVKNLTADGSNIADWAKMSTQTFNSPSGPFQVHFYQNLATGATHFADDFKAVFNHNGAWP